MFLYFSPYDIYVYILLSFYTFDLHFVLLEFFPMLSYVCKVFL
jgi:hypothetical protein